MDTNKLRTFLNATSAGKNSKCTVRHKHDLLFKRRVQFAATLKLVLLNRMAINQWLHYIYLATIADCLCQWPHEKQTHYQTLGFNQLP
ncbi:MAG: hypothetical protein EAY75_02520 [Bacteroidetes bacterium]|nr:MAG: hypothetical protein EAY75_02520 [Bacteroidota bacterium]